MKTALVKLLHKTELFKPLSNFYTCWVDTRMRKSFRKYGAETLKQVAKVASEIEKPIFLIYGTLLGAIREKGFIPYDNDLDVGMLIDDRPENMIEIMKAHGFRYYQQSYLKNGNRITEEAYDYKGVRLDIFYLYKQDADFYCYLFDRHETKSKEEANKTDGFPTVKRLLTADSFEKRAFLSTPMWVPTNAEKWLEELYGKSYMTPIKGWKMDEHEIRIEYINERVYRRFE